MRNCAVKFALLSKRLDATITAQDFLDLSPEECLESYRALLSPEERGLLMFGFSDAAILAVLDKEIDVLMEREALVFPKAFLDAGSIRIAGSVTQVFTPKEEELIESLTTWLFDITRPLYRKELSPARLEDIKAEYRENFRLFGEKYAGLDKDRLYTLFSSSKAMTEFTHAMTVDAMFKADAAKVLFGENSGYHQAWLRKQMFRWMVTGAVKKYIASCAA